MECKPDPHGLVNTSHDRGCRRGSPITLAVGCGAIVLITSLGCGQKTFLANQPASAWQSPASPVASQVQELQRRVSELDTSNRDLHTQVAQAQQQTNIFREQAQLLQKQLKDTATQLNETQTARQTAETQARSLEASVRRNGGAVITANNSIQRSLTKVDIPGVHVRQEQDVIRIELSADRLFQRGSTQILPSAYSYLDQVANAVAKNYARQRVAIEGHTDSGPTPMGAGMTNHELSVRQAVTVFEVLTRRNRLPARQLFVLGFGANYPRASNATDAGRAQNRRVELVIYPESIDS